ncbi:kinase binding protein CGI-121 [Hesseltinella vesiculosa]|uniref:EKC/KEOPS complex subunit CGI121 n=1 Tax=Hesseltinella vesiculosa TaxID=101127 RepID=A0A1X2G9B2_9FUNG|nr:kinase binding protein CGI-121 [Hesseltinella vesiculosa]
MESHAIDLYPDVGSVHMALFKDVKNAQQLRKRLLDQDTTLQCALIDASMVFNGVHVLLACNRAIHDWQHDQLKTHNVHSEIVFDFSPTSNIAQTFKRFGIDDQSQNIVVVKVGGPKADVESYMRDNIQGDLVPLDQLTQFRDMKKIRKYYQLGNQADQLDKVVPLISGAMALKGL